MGTQLLGHTQTVLCVDVTGDPAGKIVSGGEQGELCMWSLDGATIHKQKYENEEDMTSVVCSRRRPELIYTSMGNRITAFDTRQLKEPLFMFSFNEEEINQLVLNEKEDYLAACDDTGNIKIVNLFEKKVFKTLRKHTNICATVSFRPKRTWDLYSGGYDSKLIQWDFSRGRCVCLIDMEEIGEQSYVANAPSINPPFVHSVAVSSSGQFLACGTESTKIQVFNTSKRTPEFAGTLHGHGLGVSQVHFPTFADNQLVSGGNDGKIMFWNLNDLNSEAPTTNGVHHNGIGNGAAANHVSESPQLAPLGTINHAAKINWLTSGDRNNQKFLVVADNSENVTVYPYDIE